MYGDRRKDINTVVRGPLDQTSLYDPAFRTSQFVANAQFTTPKLNTLYNVNNMPVLYTQAGQAGAFQQRQVGARNLSISQVLYPNRMPYRVGV